MFLGFFFKLKQKMKRREKSGAYKRKAAKATQERINKLPKIGDYFLSKTAATETTAMKTTASEKQLETPTATEIAPTETTEAEKSKTVTTETETNETEERSETVTETETTGTKERLETVTAAEPVIAIKSPSPVEPEATETSANISAESSTNKNEFSDIQNAANSHLNDDDVSDISSIPELYLEEKNLEKSTDIDFVPLSNDPADWPNIISNKQWLDIVECGLPIQDENYDFPSNNSK